MTLRIRDLVLRRTDPAHFSPTTDSATTAAVANPCVGMNFTEPGLNPIPLAMISSIAISSPSFSMWDSWHHPG